MQLWNPKMVSNFEEMRCKNFAAEETVAFGSFSLKDKKYLEIKLLL